MKKLYLILILLISFNFSNQFTTLPNKLIIPLKCIFSSSNNIEILTNFVQTVFTKSKFNEWILSIIALGQIFKDCLGIDIMQLLPIFSNLSTVQNKKEIVLTKLQNANAPILLRRYLYDTAVKSDIFKAKRECNEITSMIPYDQYKHICNLFE